ncbi:MAG: hypothetical protein U9R06_00115, partial [Patescibacteria group bacterium]|nr:hypothetical protein [Patescibacteria group bacterium]
MRVKFIISIIIIVCGCLVIFLTNGLKLMDFSDIELVRADAGNGKVLGASEAAVEEIFKLPLNTFVEYENNTHAPVRLEGSFDYTLGSGMAAVIDVGTEKFLFKKNAGKIAPIASITKLATAFTFLDHNPGWKEIY